MKILTRHYRDLLLSYGLTREEFSVQAQGEDDVFIVLHGNITRHLEIAPRLAEHFHVGIVKVAGQPTVVTVQTTVTKYPVPGIPIYYPAGLHTWETKS